MKRLLAALPIAIFALPAYAAVDKIDSPNVEKGIAEVEYTGVRYGDHDNTLDNQQTHEVELEYGLTDRWLLGLMTSLDRDPGANSKFSTYGIEAQYQMTKQENYWFSTAIKGEYSQAYHHGDADEAEAVFLFSRESRETKGLGFVGNIHFGRELGDNRTHGVGLSSNMRAEYKVNQYLIPGIEWHADYGKLNDLGNNDSHYVGPAISGEVGGIGHGALEYGAGYYWNVNDNNTVADHAAKVELSYEFPF